MSTPSQVTTQATAAAYYLYGMEAGLCTIEDAKEWAFSVIASLEDPPIHIIDVATSKTFEDAHSSLAAAARDADVPLAGSRLLGTIRIALMSGELTLRLALRSAMQVARSTSMPRDVYYAFDGVEDALSLAENQTYGTVEQAYAYALEEFDRFSAYGEAQSNCSLKRTNQSLRD